MDKEASTFIKGYARRELDAQGMAEGDQRYASDPEFARAVDEERLLLELGILAQRERLRGQVAEARARDEGAHPSGRRVWWALAAVLVIGIGAAWILWPERSAVLYRTYFKHLGRYDTHLGSGPPNDAYTFYNNKDYAKALPELRKLTGPDADTAAIYIAFCLMALDSTEAGLEGMHTYAGASSPPDPLYYEARWYEGLGLLRLGKEEEALKVFKALQSDQAHSHRAELDAILKELDH